MRSTALTSNIRIDRRRGTLIGILGMLVLSFDALLVRLALADPADIIVWRGLLMAVSLSLVLRLRRCPWSWQLLRRDGLPALVVALGFACTMVLFVLAVLNTRVANVVVILTAAPLFAALLSGLFLREWVPVRTWLAILVCIAGIGVVFSGSVGLGGLPGDIFALMAAFMLASNLTLLRRYPHVDRLAVVAGGGMLAGLAALPFASPATLESQSILVLCVMGLVQMPLALALIGESTRYLPSAEVSLLLLLETVLGTLWVWVFLGEEPPPATLVGGVLVMLTLAVHTVLGMRRQA